VLAPSKVSRKKRACSSPSNKALSLAEVRCEQRLGGLLKHYYPRAA
jgi:hypothetical protein